MMSFSRLVSHFLCRLKLVTNQVYGVITLSTASILGGQDDVGAWHLILPLSTLSIMVKEHGSLKHQSRDRTHWRCSGEWPQSGFSTAAAYLWFAKER